MINCYFHYLEFCTILKMKVKVTCAANRKHWHDLYAVSVSTLSKCPKQQFCLQRVLRKWKLSFQLTFCDAVAYDYLYFFLYHCLFSYGGPTSVYMHDTYVSMRLICVNMQHNYELCCMMLQHVNMKKGEAEHKNSR